MKRIFAAEPFTVFQYLKLCPTRGCSSGVLCSTLVGDPHEMAGAKARSAFNLNTLPSPSKSSKSHNSNTSNAGNSSDSSNSSNNHNSNNSNNSSNSILFVNLSENLNLFPRQQNKDLMTLSSGMQWQLVLQSCSKAVDPAGRLILSDMMTATKNGHAHRPYLAHGSQTQAQWHSINERAKQVSMSRPLGEVLNPKP